MAGADQAQAVPRERVRRLVGEHPLVAALAIGAVWGLVTGVPELVIDEQDGAVRRLLVRLALGVLGVGPSIVWVSQVAAGRRWRGVDTAVIGLLVVVAIAAFVAAIAT